MSNVPCAVLYGNAGLQVITQHIPNTCSNRTAQPMRHVRDRPADGRVARGRARIDARLKGLGGHLNRSGGSPSSTTSPSRPRPHGPPSTTPDARRAVRASRWLAAPHPRQPRHRAAVMLFASRVSRLMERESRAESMPRVRMCDPPCVSFLYCNTLRSLTYTSAATSHTCGTCVSYVRECEA